MEIMNAVLPAQAGVILWNGSGYGPDWGTPRASGGDPIVNLVTRFIVWYSPRKRG